MTEFESNDVCHKDIEIKMWTCVAKQSSYIIQQHHTANSMGFFLLDIILFYFAANIILVFVLQMVPNFKINGKFILTCDHIIGFKRKTQSNIPDLSQWYSPTSWSLSRRKCIQSVHMCVCIYRTREEKKTTENNQALNTPFLLPGISEG